MGADCPEDAAATATRASAAGRFARGRAGDLLYFVLRLPMASSAKRVPAVLDGTRLFLCLARQRQVAQDRQSPGPPSAAETRAQADTDGSRYRQPNGFDDAGRRATWI